MDNIKLIDIVWAFNLLYGALHLYPHEKGFWKWFGLWCILGGLFYFLIT